jgi:hypothetical protein
MAPEGAQPSHNLRRIAAYAMHERAEWSRSHVTNATSYGDACRVQCGTWREGRGKTQTLFMLHLDFGHPR